MSEVMKPTLDRVLGEEVVETVSKGGIIIPATADPTGGDKLAARRVKVVAVGPGTVHVTDSGEKIRVTVSDMLGVSVKPGDYVITTRYIQLLNLDNGRKLRLFRADDISAVMAPVDGPLENQ